jgi:hypothetical protein
VFLLELLFQVFDLLQLGVAIDKKLDASVPNGRMAKPVRR